MLFKAQDKKIVKFEVINIRDFGLGSRLRVDDSPYGGGDGMLLMVEPLYKTISYVKALSDHKLTIILPSPRGETYLQSDANRLANLESDFLILCPRYEGYDERIVNFVDEVFSIGNFVLTGGDIPAMVIVDSITRLLPGVLGGETSVINESFQVDDVSKEFPQYTRPEEFMGLNVPKVLLSGNHRQIIEWRNLQIKK